MNTILLQPTDVWQRRGRELGKGRCWRGSCASTPRRGGNLTYDGACGVVTDADLIASAEAAFLTYDKEEAEHAGIERGEIWRVDFGLAAKARPAVVFNIPFLDHERAVHAIVPHTMSQPGYNVRFYARHRLLVRGLRGSLVTFRIT